MRLFIAIDLPKEIKDYIEEIQKEIKDNNFRLRLTTKKTLHLTLKFLGELKNYRLIEERLEKIKIKRFKLKLDKIGYFPEYGMMKIIWIGLRENKELMQLQNIIDMETLDLSKSDMRYNLHITMAKTVKIKDIKKAKERLEKIKIKKLEFEVKEIVMYETKTSNTGPKYVPLIKYRLE